MFTGTRDGGNTSEATYQDITGLYGSITISQPVSIFATMSFEAETVGVGTDATIDCTIAIDSGNTIPFERFLGGTNDKGIGAITVRSAVLSAGTYDVRGRYRRSAGTKSVMIDNATLTAFALQGAVGQTGVSGAIGTQGTSGAIGAAGESGAIGAQGSQGPVGATGASGTRWYVGESAPASSLGAQNDLYLITGGALAYSFYLNTGNGEAATWIYVGDLSGAKGNDGESGAIGADGAQGPQGDTGASGAIGATGPQGDPGPQGATGVSGTRWYVGEGTPASSLGTTNDLYLVTGGSLAYNFYLNTGNGEETTWIYVGNLSGSKGIDGESGAIGATGPQGPAGPTGESGAIGVQGLQGPVGDTGASGAIGAIGPQGPQGDTGASGAIGATGPQGPVGDTGASGAIGATGPQGDPGPQGATGISGSRWYVGEGVPASSLGNQNDLYLVTGGALSYSFYLNTGNGEAVSWIYVGDLSGSKGTDGESGAIGAQGESGAIGTQGESGAIGTQGIQGDLGPQGATGTSGSRWYVGESAPPSTLGNQNDLYLITGGVLAYSFYLNTGNGEASTWIYVGNLSGAIGTAGESGAIGAQGESGAIGATGPQGPAGATGESGAIGTQGVQGEVGPQGATGVSGTRWYAGETVPASSLGTTNDLYLITGGALAYSFYLNTGNGEAATWIYVGNLTGARGTDGESGAIGAQGESGAIGADGESGAIGAQGESGAIGAQGESGAIGTQGIQGETGPEGATGISGSRWYVGEVTPASSLGTQNDLYLITGGALSYNFYLNTGNGEAATWIYVGNLSGSMGPAGESGAIGAQGESGAIGTQGESGAIGAQGESGAIGPIGLAGPTGESGAIGAQGPQGELGPPGPSGATGAIGMRWRGEYALTTYIKYDVVTRSTVPQTAWILTGVDSVSATPPETNQHLWSLFSSGAQGESGAIGAQGAAGGPDWTYENNLATSLRSQGTGEFWYVSGARGSIDTAFIDTVSERFEDQGVTIEGVGLKDSILVGTVVGIQSGDSFYFDDTDGGMGKLEATSAIHGLFQISKSFTISDPTVGDDIPIGPFEDSSIVLQKVQHVLPRATSTPRVQWNLTYAGDTSVVSGARGTGIWGIDSTSAAGVDVELTFNDTVIGANEVWFVEVTGAAGSVPYLTATVYYKKGIE
jgi:hypothetical protein